MRRYYMGDQVRLEGCDKSTIVGTHHDGSILLGWKANQKPHPLSWSICRTHLSMSDLSEHIDHFDDYKQGKWVYLHEIDVEPAEGYTCIDCGTYYPQSVPNMPDNKLKCFSCRN